MELNQDYLNCIEDIDTIDFEKSSIKQSPLPAFTDSASLQSSTSSHSTLANQSSSQILQELVGQIDELQDKLKINYRKLLLFETENKKLTEENNVLFYSGSDLKEQIALLKTKHEAEAKLSHALEQQLKLANQKIEALEKIQEAQSADLKRFSKFHTKIKNIIKPYVLTLKEQVKNLETTTQQEKKIKEQYHLLNLDLNEKNNSLKSTIDKIQTDHKNEKNEFIKTYEEQIHFLSKEIVEQQQKAYDAEQENIRLKKISENKNYLENELIRYKRQQETDQKLISELKKQVHTLETSMLCLSSEKDQLNTDYQSIKSDFENKTIILDNCRLQLSQKIDDYEKLLLRIKMLEKINTQLSINLSTNHNA